MPMLAPANMPQPTRPRSAASASGAALAALAGYALSQPVRRALDYLLRNYADPITVQDMADLSDRTPFQMIRAFRKELGVTPHALLIRIRVLRATAMLEQGEPIAGVAVDVGFVDQTHFTRHFKRVHGETPRRFLRERALALGLP
jgi:transcriptional regulator GlxA family with amidase domain